MCYIPVGLVSFQCAQVITKFKSGSAVRQFAFRWGGSSCSSGAAVRVPVGRQFVSSKAIVRVPVDANLQSFLPFNHLQSTDKI